MPNIRTRIRTRTPIRTRTAPHSPRHALALATAALLGLGAAPDAQAAACTWNTTAGNWNAIANWLNCITGNGNPSGAPGAADSASIGSTGVVAVTNAQAINALTNAGRIDIGSGGSLLLNAGGGGTSNSGTIQVASGAVLTFDGRSFAHAIGGGGEIVLSGGTVRMEGANTTTLAAGSAIRGAGSMGSAGLVNGAMSFVNNGSFSADVNGGSLVLNAPAGSGSYTNNSLFEARNGGTLQLNANLSQGSGGVLQALDGSTVRLNGVTVAGGTLSTVGTGAIVASNNSANLLSQVTLSGVVDLSGAASQLRVANGLAFSGGAIHVGANTLYIDNRANQGLAANQELSGTGALTLAGGIIRFETSSPAQTTIGSGLSISGWGNIGQAGIQSGQHTLVNNGLISASSAGNTLALQPISNGALPVQNNGILEATGGGILRLDTGVVGGSGSQLRAAADSRILMNGVTVSGEINTTGTGTVTASNNSANLLSDVSLNGVIDLSLAPAQLRVGNNLVLQPGSSIRVGTNTLYIDNRSNQGLASAQALSGSGNISLAGGSIRFETNTPAQTTIANGVSVAGWGTFGQAGLQGGQHTLINEGLISANASGNTLVIQPIGNSALPLQNNSVLEATAGGILRLDTHVAGASGSQLRAEAGSRIVMNGVTVSGAVNTTGGGTVTASNTSANLLSNTTLNGLIDLSGGGSQLRVGNGLVLQDNASITVGSSTLYLDVRDNSGLSLTQAITGNGSITMAGGNIRMETNLPGGTTLGDGVSIAGFGNLGGAGIQAGNFSFVNAGMVAANVNGETLQVLRPSNNGSFSNQALMSASNGGVLQLSGSISQTASGLIQALEGSAVQINNVTVSGGTLATAGNGVIRTSNNSTNLLNDVTLSGVVDMASAASQLRVGNGLAFSGGTINVGAGSALYLDNRDNNGLPASQVLSGNGSITLAGGNIRLEANNPAQTRIGSGVTVSGWGNIGPAALQSGTYALVNDGSIEANTAGQTLALQPLSNGSGSLSGSGTLRVAGGTLSLATGRPSSQGTLDIGASGTLATNNQNLTLGSDYISAQWGSGNSFNRRAGISGSGQILAGGDVLQFIAGANVSNGNTANATLSIGNVRVGTSSFEYSVANGGSTGPTLRGAIQTTVNGANLDDARLGGTGVAPGLYNAGAPGFSSGPLGVSFSVASAGPIAPLTGQVLNFRSNFENIADQQLNIVVAPGAAAYNAAVGHATPTPVQLAAQRLGGSLTQTLTLSNTAPAGAFSEDLNAQFGSSTGLAQATGAVTGVLAGGSSGGSGSLVVGVDTSLAGAHTGSVQLNFTTAGAVAGVPNGLGTAPAGTQVIDVSGRVYAPATAQLNTPAVNFGIVRVGDAVAAQNVAVANTTSGALTDTLRASLAGGASPFTAAGTATAIAAGSTDAGSLNVTLNTAVAGVYAGSATVTFTSQNPEMADLPLGTAMVGLSAQVNNLADTSLAHAGAGSFSGGLLSYTLDFGTVFAGEPGGTAMLGLSNSASGPADALAGVFDLGALQPGDPFALAGFSDFSGLAAGSSLTGLTVSFGGMVEGSFERVLVLNRLSTNGSGPDLALAPVELRLIGSVTAVPEPGTWAMWLAGLVMLGNLLRRRLRAQA